MSDGLPAATRAGIALCAALAVLTPFLAGALSWGYLDESQRHGVLFYALYWPMLLLGALPPRASAPLLDNALPAVLMYFAGYLLAGRLLRALLRRFRSARAGRSA